MGRSPWHPRLTTWVDRVDLHWQRLGLATALRRELRVELVADLAQALLAGAPMDELLAVDPERFADDVAVAHGGVLPAAEVALDWAEPTTSDPPVTSRPEFAAAGRVAGVVGAGLFGALVGGIVSLALLLPVIGWVDRPDQLSYAAQGLAMLAIYAAAGLVAALGGGLAVGSVCAEPLQRGRLVRRATVGLMAGGVAATIVTVAFAASTGYSTSPSVVVCELGLVLVTLTLGLVVVATPVAPSGAGPQGRASRQPDRS